MSSTTEAPPAATAAPLAMIPPAVREAIHIGVDELPFVDLGDRSALQLLHVDLTQGLWVVRMRFQPGYRVARHYHTGPVFAVTSKGSWNYVEYPQYVNREGSYLFEPAGSVHTLVVPEDQKGETEVWFAVFGANVNLDDEGRVVEVIDAAKVLAGYRMLCAMLGRSADKVIVFGE
jgi:quercetin dioxygenase-like cupin family protein